MQRLIKLHNDEKLLSNNERESIRSLVGDICNQSIMINRIVRKNFSDFHVKLLLNATKYKHYNILNWESDFYKFKNFPNPTSYRLLAEMKNPIHELVDKYNK